MLESGTALNAVIETNQQLRSQVQTLVDALKLMPEVAYKSIIESAGVSVENLPNELQCICDAALAEAKVTMAWKLITTTNQRKG